MLEYEELRIRLRNIGTRRYLVLANGPAAAAAAVSLDREPGVYWRQYNQLIEAELNVGPAGKDPVQGRLKDLGRELHGILLPDSVSACLKKGRTRAGRQRIPRGLRLRFDLPAELGDLPVESLAGPAKTPQQTFAFDHDLSLVRSLRGSGHQVRLPKPDDPPEQVRILAAVASAQGGPLVSSGELADLREELSEESVNLTTLPNATLEDIEKWLDDCRTDPAVVLLIAHGDYDEQRGCGVLYLEARDGSTQTVTSDRLGGMLVKAQRLCLVVLNLCSGAISTEQEPFSGLAQALIGHGIPAVIAMQSKVSGTAAARFSPLLLKKISENCTIDEAMNAARRRLADIPHQTAIEWSTPVLFLHEECRHGWLFKAREVSDAVEEPADPLRSGAEAHAIWKNPRGRLSTETVVRAARFLRDGGQWPEVLRVARTRHLTDEQVWLIEEARLELALPLIEQFCAALADEHGPGPARTHLAVLTEQELPGDVLDCLRKELHRAEEEAEERVLAGLYAAAWKKVVEGGRAVRGSAWWQEIAAEYGGILNRRADSYGDAHGLKAYCHGRALEAEGRPDWAKAVREYGSSADALDAAARLLRARGYLAAEGGRWQDARDALVQAVEFGLPDDGWLSYVCGRHAEELGRWSAAAAAYRDTMRPSDVSSRRPGIRERLSYSLGRAADQRGAWHEAIDRFGSLSDDYEEGEVERRRSFARARIAEREGNWEAVLVALTDLGDDRHEGDVAILRGKARARTAEESDDWGRAVDEYAAVADRDEALRRRRSYALGRKREAEGDWAGAGAAYSTLPDEQEYADVPLRLHYVRARKAEDEAADEPAWAAVITAYMGLPGEFEDVACRMHRARARQAEAAGDWQLAIAEAAKAGAMPGCPDPRSLADYASGRLNEDRGDWSEAARAYALCPSYRDGAGRQAYAQGRLLEDRDEWRAAIDAYGRPSGGPGHPGSAERQQRLEMLRAALPWADGLTRSVLVADPFARDEGSVDYLTLGDAGITPGSSTEQVRNAVFAMLERGAMTWHQRVAWERLRSPAQRMRLDATLYRLRDPAGLHAQLAALQPGRAADLVDRLCQALPEDAPLLILLARGRDQAIEAWERDLLRAPGDVAIAHSLAVAHFWRAQELEAGGAWEQAESAWEQALMYWAVLLTNDDYWSVWHQARAEAYTVTSAEKARLRRELGQDLFDRLSAYATGHAQLGRSEQEATYRGLANVFEVELEGAQALKEVGGLAFPDSTGRNGACGPAYLRHTGLNRALGELVARLMKAGEPGADEAAMHRLRSAFSELARAYTCVEHHRFEPALKELRAPLRRSLAELPPDCAAPDRTGEHMAACQHCRGFVEHNPAYTFLPNRRALLLQDAADLAVRAHLELARNALAGGKGIDLALEKWQDAIEVSRMAATTVRTKERIVRMVLGRVDVLARAVTPGQGESLDEAIDLIERARVLLSPVVAKLQARQAEVLTDRGVWRWYRWRESGNESNLSRSAVDLRDALRLNPESMRTRENLVSALLSTLDKLSAAGEPERELRLLNEALGIVHEGLKRMPNHSGLLQALGLVLDKLDSLVLGRLSLQQLRDLIEQNRTTPEPTGDPAARAGELRRAAELKRQGGDRSGALRDLLRAAGLDRANEQIRQFLIETVEEEISDSPRRGGTS
jgi:tetratricopeptide (TPR) repeat protein